MDPATIDVRNWRLLERHPESREHGDIDVGQMATDLKEFGNLTGRKITLSEHEGADKVLDGWQFYRAHLAIDLRPEFARKPDGVSDHDYARVMEDNRRHDAEAVAARRARVAAKRQAGDSLRTIAEKEDVSISTVARDLGAFEEKGGKIEAFDVRIFGRDGKKYPATKERCVAETDAIGLPVPPQLVAVFRTRELFETAKRRLELLSETLDQLAHSEGGGRLIRHLEQRKQARSIVYHSARLDELLREIGSSVPHASVCPFCYSRENYEPSDDCSACRGQGWVDLHFWNSATREARKKVEQTKQLASGRAER